eukprot:1515838-Pleurochrysis_carterae.AAC.1
MDRTDHRGGREGGKARGCKRVERVEEHVRRDGRLVKPASEELSKIECLIKADEVPSGTSVNIRRKARVAPDRSKSLFPKCGGWPRGPTLQARRCRYTKALGPAH